MRLDVATALARLTDHDHGVLATSNRERGVDAVPVVYVVDAGIVGIPVDQVKPKASSRLQRERNLESDPRATLLVDHWDAHDWTRLWWVRAELRWQPEPTTEQIAMLGAGLAHRYPQYADQPFTRVLVFDTVAVSGWSATA